MASSIVAAQLSSFLKVSYPKKISNNVVSPAIVFNNTEFGEDVEPGQKVVVPTLLAPEQGVTYGTASSVATVNGAIALEIDDATINPAQISIKSVLPLDVVQRAKTSQQAFETATTLRFREQRKTILCRTEWTWLYGGEAMAQISGAPSNSGATVVLKSHSPALCSTLLNAQLDAYATGTSTKRNTNAALVVAGVLMGANGAVTLTLSGNGSDLAALADTDDLFFYGAKSVEATGLMAQVSNTGTLFGIDASTKPGFKGNTITSVGAINISKLQDGVALCKQFLPEDDLTVFVSVRNFARLVEEQQTNQRWMEGGKNAKVGFTGLALSSGNIRAMVVEHPFVKDADALVLPLPQVIKVGTSEEPLDATSAGDLIVYDHTTLSYVYTMYLACVPFLRKPNQACRMSGITIS